MKRLAKPKAQAKTPNAAQKKRVVKGLQEMGPDELNRVEGGRKKKAKKKAAKKKRSRKKVLGRRNACINAAVDPPFC